MKTKKTEKKPAKPGRKAAKFDLKKVEKYAAMGLTKEDIGRALGYERTAFYKAKANDQAIEDAIKRGRAKFKVLLSAELVKQMRAGNVTAAIWLDKTRCGVREDSGQGDDESSNAQPVSVTIKVEDASNRSDSKQTTGPLSGNAA